MAQITIYLDKETADQMRAFVHSKKYFAKQMDCPAYS